MTTSRTIVRGWYGTLFGLLVAAMAMSLASWALAGFYRGGAVGGIVIQDDGVVQDATVQQRLALARNLREDLQPPTADANRAVEMRKISLKALEAAVQNALTDGSGTLPDEIKYLGGLQRVQYVFVYPEQQDIVLAGPAEGWKVDKYGNVVGVTSGRPVVQLDDLIVALRVVGAARQGGIRCSINPTPEGWTRLRKLLDAEKLQGGQQRDLVALERRMQEAFGPQIVSLTGAPPNSHFARVLVAADYRMKRLAMGLDKAPIDHFPSYVEMLRTAKDDPEMNPRWWLACNYEPVAKSDDDLAWELRGQGVKCLTEDDVFTADGQAQQTGKSSPTAKAWADMMTDQYDALSRMEPVFGELRNVMDLCIVAAVIDQNRLLERAGCSLSLLTNSTSDLLMPRYWNAPKTVPPQCSFFRHGKGLTVTASGGVEIALFDVATQTQTNDAIERTRQSAGQPTGNKWWWN